MRSALLVCLAGLALVLPGCGRLSTLVVVGTELNERYPDAEIGLAYHNGFDHLLLEMGDYVPEVPEGSEEATKREVFTSFALEVAITVYALYPDRDELKFVSVDLTTGSRALGLVDETSTVRFPVSFLEECYAHSIEQCR